MDYTLVRFHQVNGIRQYAFEYVCADRSKLGVVVQADLALARKYDIRLQELPLLCRRLLDTLPVEGLGPAVMLSESYMLAIQTAARITSEKKPSKPPKPSPAVGRAWRNPSL